MRLIAHPNPLGQTLDGIAPPGRNSSSISLLRPKAVRELVSGMMVSTRLAVTASASANDGS